MFSDRRTPNRQAPSWWQRINPLFWLGDTERPIGKSAFLWFFRNPCCNFNAVIIGVSHKHRTCYYAKGDGWTYASRGWNYGYTKIDGCPIPLPFVSYRGERWERMLGWKTSGAFGYAWRVTNAKGWTP
jgi:hypothetical protein